MMTDTRLILLPTKNGDCKLVTNGLEIAPGLSFEAWENIGITLDLMAKSLQFAIGDWLNYGERAYGEMYAQAMNLTEYNYHSLKNLAYVARHVPMSLRRDRLTYSIHVEVASLDEDVQARLLETAEADDWTVLDMRQACREEKQHGDSPAPYRRICPECGAELT